MSITSARPGVKVRVGIKYPSQVVAVAPLYASMSGGVLTLTFSDADILGGDCWVWQLKKALANVGSLLTVDINIPADPSQSINILWTVGARTTLGDTLSNFIKSTLGWTDDQMTTLYNSAKLQIT